MNAEQVLNLKASGVSIKLMGTNDYGSAVNQHGEVDTKIWIAPSLKGRKEWWASSERIKRERKNESENNNREKEPIRTFAITSMWFALLALPLPLVALTPLMPTVLPHNKLLDCFEPSLISLFFRWLGRCNIVRITQNVVNTMVVNAMPNKIGDNWYDSVSIAAG